MGLEDYLIEHSASISSESKVFPDGGFYVMRHKDLYMIVDCVPNNNPKAPSGHRHNSGLSFELFAYGKTFILDLGAYIYLADPKWRNRFRSTAYHNTVVVDGEEQNEFDAYNVFGLEKNAEVEVNEWKIDLESDFLDVQHNGYERLAFPIIHRRQFIFNKRDRYWIIRDILQKSPLLKKHRIKKRKHRFDWYFHFAPMEIIIDRKDPLVVSSNAADDVNLMLIPIEADGFSLEVFDSWISYSYGTKIEAPVVKYSKIADTPVSFVIVLYPYVSQSLIKSGMSQELQSSFSFNEIKESALTWLTLYLGTVKTEENE